MHSDSSEELEGHRTIDSPVTGVYHALDVVLHEEDKKMRGQPGVVGI